MAEAPVPFQWNGEDQKREPALEKVIEHVERYWCPTITNTSLSGKPRFRFREDRPDGAKAAAVPDARQTAK